MANAGMPLSGEAKELLQLRGTLVDIIFRENDGLWSICRFLSPDNRTFTAIGEFGLVILYEEFNLHGAWSPEIDGGDFEVIHFSTMPPAKIEHLAGYLSSLTHVPRTATQKLVEYFGDSTIEVLDKDPGRLEEAGLKPEQCEKLAKAWLELRSKHLAKAKIDIQGVPQEKLAQLQRILGYHADINQCLNEDPFLLYIHFPDMLFEPIRQFAERLKVPVLSMPWVKGAVIASLRRQAWQGHSCLDGRSLTRMVSTILKVPGQDLKELLPEAAITLVNAGLVHITDGMIQLSTLHRAEVEIVSHAKELGLRDAEMIADLTPSSPMTSQIVEPLQLGSHHAAFCSGIRALLDSHWVRVEVDTFEEQIDICKGLSLIIHEYGSGVVFCSYTPEMASEIEANIPCDQPVATYSTLIGTDPKTGIPRHHKRNPLNAETVVIVGADSFGCEELKATIEAVKPDARLYLIGAVTAEPSPTVGQPFEDLKALSTLRSLNAQMWSSNRTPKRNAVRQIQTGRLPHLLEEFDPTKPITWLRVPREQIPICLAQLMLMLAEAAEIDALRQIKIATPYAKANVPGEQIQTWLEKEIIKTFLPGVTSREFQGRVHTPGLPVYIKQVLTEFQQPAFSLYDVIDVTQECMTLRTFNGSEIVIPETMRADIIPAGVALPRFLKGRRFEYIVLVVLKEFHEAINKGLLIDLMNASRKSIILFGELDGIEIGFEQRNPNKSRSLICKFIEATNVD